MKERPGPRVSSPGYSSVRLLPDHGLMNHLKEGDDDEKGEQKDKENSYEGMGLGESEFGPLKKPLP